MSRDVVIVQTGTANTASVMAGLRRAGARPVLGATPEEVANADRVVLPGVGAMAAAMGRLEADGVVDVLNEGFVGDFDGPVDRIEGEARVLNEEPNASLSVDFVGSPLLQKIPSYNIVVLGDMNEDGRLDAIFANATWASATRICWPPICCWRPTARASQPSGRLCSWAPAASSSNCSGVIWAVAAKDADKRMASTTIFMFFS